jgi:predicted acylesterase/phospholipase RssA
MITGQSTPEDRFCDLVMKGGVTSGVVYPKAIRRLADHYRFKNIGGTSAGAIAASVSAAAEYQRRHTGSSDGFARLDRLPDELGAREVKGGASRLLRLFQPQPATKRLFFVLAGALNRGSLRARIAHVILGLLRAYWIQSVLALILSAAVVMVTHSLWAAFLTFVVAGCGLLLRGVYRDVAVKLTENGFGFCTGMTVPGNPDAALTPWLHGLIQEAAGLRADDPPLTFGALWDAPGFPPKSFELPLTRPNRSINLQMFTTNLSHGRPYVLPFEEGDKERSQRPHVATQQRLFYRREELARYMPEDVMTWVQAHSEPYRMDPDRARWDPADADGAGLLELPPPRDFPVVLAARMSLSFPILFCAVPLWAIDYDPAEGPGKRKFKRCWFSDGGISSNFPIHMFDGWVPMWPTFGISLEPKLKERPNMTYLPQNYYEGYGERWQRFDEAGQPMARMGGFLFSLISTMQEWNDNTLSRMPGVRDRVVRVRLNADEGGLNLDMPESAINTVSLRGAEAAEELIKRYVAPSTIGPEAAGWDQQRFVRLNVLMRMLEKRLPGVKAAMGKTPHATDLKDLIAQMQGERAPGFDRPLTPDEATALLEMCDSLTADDFMPHSGNGQFVAVPEPELRVRPAL